MPIAATGSRPSSLLQSTSETDVVTSTKSTTTTYSTTTTTPSPQDLEHAFCEIMWKMKILQEDLEFQATRPPKLRSLLGACQKSVHVAPSTIPAAGQGLFASCDIAAGSIVTFYPVHALGVHFRDGSCFYSGHHEVTSQYVMNLIGNRPILDSIDLENDFDGMGFVDADPERKVAPAWLCHRINDGAIIEDNTPESVMEYYHKSLVRQNILFLPFGPAPLVAAVATRGIAKGDELFSCYGRSYWLVVVEGDLQNWSLRTQDIIKTEQKVAETIQEATGFIQSEYAQEETELYQAFYEELV